MRGRSLLVALERVALTLWVGGLWVTGYVAAPLFFATLSDRRLAGELAGHLFSAMSMIGLACGVFLLVAALVRIRTRFLRAWRVWVLLLMLALTLVGEFVLLPAVQAIRAQAGTALIPGHPLYGAFSRLHGIASILFLVNSLAGLVLVILPGRASRELDYGPQ
jgi:hypothetical protein